MREAGDIPCGGFPEFRGSRRTISHHLRDFHNKCVETSPKFNEVLNAIPFAKLKTRWWHDEISLWRHIYHPTGIREVAVNVTQAANTARNSLSRLQNQMTISVFSLFLTGLVKMSTRHG